MEFVKMTMDFRHLLTRGEALRKKDFLERIQSVYDHTGRSERRLAYFMGVAQEAQYASVMRTCNDGFQFVLQVIKNVHKKRGRKKKIAN